MRSVLSLLALLALALPAASAQENLHASLKVGPAYSLQDNFPEVPEWFYGEIGIVALLTEAGLADWFMGQPDVVGSIIRACDRLRDPDKFNKAQEVWRQRSTRPRPVSNEILAGLKQLIRLHKESLRHLRQNPDQLLIEVQTYIEGQERTFEDMPQGHWAAKGVEDLRRSALLHGYPTPRPMLSDEVPDVPENNDLYQSRADLLVAGAADVPGKELWQTVSRKGFAKTAIEAYNHFREDKKAFLYLKVRSSETRTGGTRRLLAAFKALDLLADVFSNEIAAAGVDPAKIHADVKIWRRQLENAQ